MENEQAVHKRLTTEYEDKEAKRENDLRRAVWEAKSQWRHRTRNGRRKSNRKRIRPDTLHAMLVNAGSYKPRNALREIESVWGEGMPRAAAGQIRNAARRLVRGRSVRGPRGGGTRRSRRHSRRTRRRRRH